MNFKMVVCYVQPGMDTLVNFVGVEKGCKKTLKNVQTPFMDDPLSNITLTYF